MEHKKKRKTWTRHQWVLLLTAMPFVGLVFVFQYIPLFGWIFAFMDYRPGIPIMNNSFVGLKHFISMFSSWNQISYVLTNTFALSFLGLLMSPLPIVFAIMLTEMRNKVFKRILQTTTTLPNFISWILVFSVFFVFFSTEGAVNNILLKIGIIDEPTRLLTNTSAAWYFQTAIALWKGLGWGAIIYLAAIAGISQELYDAAEVDGAARFRRIWHVTLPGVMPTFIVIMLLNISSILNSSFEQYFVFMNPLVMEKLEVIDYYTYRIGLLTGQFSYSTSISMLKSLLSIVLLFGVNWLSKKVRGESII